MTKEIAAFIGVLILLSVTLLFVGDAIRKALGRKRPGLVPYGVHVLAGLLFFLGVAAAVNSWNEDYTWYNLVAIPIVLVLSVYGAFLLVCIRIPEKRKIILDRIVGLLSWRTT